MKKILKPEWLLWGLLPVLFSCEEKAQDCLDSFAVNYSVEADEACSFCCVYPILSADFNHKFSRNGELSNLSFGSIVEDGFGNPFTIEGLNFYLSDFSLSGTETQNIQVEDELVFEAEIAGRTTEEVIKDDVLYVSAGSIGGQSCGTFRGEGRFDQVRITLGLPDATNGLLFASLPEGHALEMKNDSSNLNREGSYVVLNISYKSDTLTDTRLESLKFEASELSLPLTFPASLNLSRGSQLLLIWTIDYSNWFAEVNVREQTPAEIKEKIRTNLAGAFALSEVRIQ